MQWRSARASWLALPVLLVIAGCQDDSPTGPRIASLAIISGNGQTGPIGGLLPQPLVVQVKDQSGTAIQGAIVSFAVMAGNGTPSAAADTTGADGYAQTTFRLGSGIGVQAVSASLPGQDPVSFALNASSAPASKLTLISGDGQTAKVGTLLDSSLVVKVTDAFDNLKAGIPVSFTVSANGGTVSATTVVTDVQGIGKVRWTAGTAAGTALVTANSGSIAQITFTATITPDQPARIIVLSGNNQTGQVGAPLTDSVVVRVLDQYGNPVSGAAVDWVPGTGGGTAAPATSLTGNGGRTATKWTLGSSGGPKSLSVQIGSSLATRVDAAVPVSYTSISTGGRHTCGLGVGGVVYCWGFNGDAELGIGDVAAGSGPIFTTPQPTATVGNWTFRDIATGMGHSCAVALTGEAFCWGSNVDGRIGQESHTQTRFKDPQQVHTTYTFVSIVAGRATTCGIGFSTRPVCWGSNHDGEAGVMGGLVVTTDSSTIDFPQYINNPVFSLGAVSITEGGVHGCAATASGETYCWGNNVYGQLGDGTNSRSPRPSHVTGGHLFASVAGGGYHTCGLKADGTAWCWGLNTTGQLGGAAAADTTAPGPVAGGVTFTKLAAGSDHTCGLAADGTAYCWGGNDKGQLGDGTVASHSAPTAVAAGLTFKAISAGDQQTCGVTTANVAYCWGNNEYGAVGDGTLINRLIPTKVRLQL